MKKLTIADFFGIVFFLIIAGYLYVGFFHPDPYYTEDIYVPRVKTLLWLLRIGFPVLVLSLIALYVGIRRGKISMGQIGLSVGTLVFAFIVIYPVANSYFQKHYLQKIELFHPFLQLTPHDFMIRPGDRNNKFVIVCLGGSTTEFKDHAGIGWTDRLETFLQNTIPGKQVEVYNQGRQWYTTQHALINYEINIRPKHPDMIIVMQSINDLAQNADFAYFSHGNFRDDYGHFYGPINRILERESLFDYCWTMIKGCWYYTPRTVVDSDTFPGLPSYQNKLQTIIDLAKHDSTKVVLMTEAFLFKDPISDDERAALYMLNHEAIGPTKQWSLSTAIRGMNSYNDACRKLASDNKLLLIDLEKIVPKSLDYFYDEVHYQDTTHILVAHAIADRLTGSGLLK